MPIPVRANAPAEVPRRAAPLLVAIAFAGCVGAPGDAGAETAAATLCANHKTCRIVQATPAGADVRGRALAVVELDTGGDDAGLPCRPYRREFWLTIAGDKPQRLFVLCNDGQGSGRVHEDRVTVGPNRLAHFQLGGSDWRWSAERIMSLVPFRIAREEHCAYHGFSSGFGRARWDWNAFKAEIAWRPQPCTDDDRPGDTVGCDARPPTRAHTAIPRFEPAAALMEKPLHLGSCATVLSAAPAELRMLMTSPRDLFLTIADAPASLDGEARLELWLGPHRVGLSCPADSKEPMVQWHIAITDGTIRAASGAGEPPKVARFTARSVGGRREVTIRLVLPGHGTRIPGMTLAYSRADGAGRRVVATGTVTPGDPTTLGSVRYVEPRGATCAERDGRLDLVETGLPAALVQ